MTIHQESLVFAAEVKEELVEVNCSEQSFCKEKSLNQAGQATAAETCTLREAVYQTMSTYFQDLDGYEACDVYNMVLCEIEPPLLRSVLEYVQGNQTKAAEILGLNRGTLRKKLKQYDLA
ncbi:MAG: DNA-binding transcriptional regulator Fis [Pseudomonadota bacterium]